jgi:hypothetical protein
VDAFIRTLNVHWAIAEALTSSDGKSKRLVMESHEMGGLYVVAALSIFGERLDSFVDVLANYLLGRSGC